MTMPLDKLFTPDEVDLLKYALSVYEEEVGIDFHTYDALRKKIEQMAESKPLLCEQCGKPIIRIGCGCIHAEFDNTHTAILPRIGDTVGVCPKCGWTGKVDDMEPDVDGDGSLGCPKCGAVIVVR